MMKFQIYSTISVIILGLALSAPTLNNVDKDNIEISIPKDDNSVSQKTSFEDELPGKNVVHPKINLNLEDKMVADDRHPIDDDPEIKDELSGKNVVHPQINLQLEDNMVVDTEDQNTISDDPEIDAKTILEKFIDKLKKNPEIIENLIESEEQRLLERYEQLSDLSSQVLDQSNDENEIVIPQTGENSQPVPYESEKAVVKKSGKGLLPEYDPRSASNTPTSGSDLTNNQPAVTINNNENVQPTKEEIEAIAKLQDEYSQANPFINPFPEFIKLSHQHTDKAKSEETDSANTVEENLKSNKQKLKSSQPKPSSSSSQSVYDIEEIKHVPIEEELVSELPPSQLASKKDLIEEAHRTLKKAEAEANKVKQYQESIQQEELQKMAEQEELHKMAQQYQNQAYQQQNNEGQSPENVQGPKDVQSQEDVQSSEADTEDLSDNSPQDDKMIMDPETYFLYYYNYPEQALSDEDSVSASDEAIASSDISNSDDISNDEKDSSEISSSDDFDASNDASESSQDSVELGIGRDSESTDISSSQSSEDNSAESSSGESPKEATPDTDELNKPRAREAVKARGGTKNTKMDQITTGGIKYSPKVDELKVVPDKIIIPAEQQHM